MRNKYLFSLLFMRLNSSRFRFVYAASLLFSLSLCHFCVFEFCCMVVCAVCPMCRGCVFVARAKRASDKERVRERAREMEWCRLCTVAHTTVSLNRFDSVARESCVHMDTPTHEHTLTHTHNTNDCFYCCCCCCRHPTIQIVVGNALHRKLMYVYTYEFDSSYTHKWRIGSSNGFRWFSLRGAHRS